MRDLSELPDGWRILRLEDVAEVNPRRPTLNIPIDVPTTFVPMAAVGENCRGLIAYQSRPYGEVSKGYTYFENNDVTCLRRLLHAYRTESMHLSARSRVGLDLAQPNFIRFVLAID